MLMLKIFAFSSCATATAVIGTKLYAQATGVVEPGAATGILALVGVFTMLSTAAIGAYGKFRETKAKADADDCKVKIAELKAELERLNVQVKQWRDLYEATRSPSRPRRGSE